MRKALKLHVRKEIGALAVPDDIRFTSSLPKTRSGKIMRRLLRDIAAGVETGEIFKLSVREEIARAKYIPEKGISKITQVRTTIEEQIKELQGTAVG